MSVLGVDPDGLRNTGPRFGAVAADITTAAEQLRRVLDTEGQCWGTDQVGQAFAKRYTPDPGLEAIQDVRDAFTRYGEDVVTLADNVEAQEQIISGNLGSAAS
ncbi:WXG100 family type VII secretion target [Nocardia sp. NPDC051750]|uniref:WXG100 family type VII secretion target n=1 Tax=Nocardia sp. NPDC051750 TaxID=3364325 RepID=UPI00379741D6